MPSSNKGKRGPGWGKKPNNYMMDPLGARASIAKAQGRGVVKESTSGGRYIDWKAKRPKDYETGLVGLKKRTAADKKRKRPTILTTAANQKKNENDEEKAGGTGLIKG
jgi:hypothetical protein